MTHQDLVRKTAELASVPIHETRRVIDSALGAIADELRSSGVVNIKDIGKLVRVFRMARPGRNPRTGEKVLIPDRQSVKFKPSKNLEL